MSVLHEIGIQTWRLRQRPSLNDAVQEGVSQIDTDGDTVLPTTVDHPIEANVSDAATIGTENGLSQGEKVDVASVQAEAIQVEPIQAEPVQAGSDWAVTDISLPEAIDNQIVVAPASTGFNLEGSDWQGLVEVMESTQLCGSCAASNPYLGEGDINADWLFVLDAPSRREIHAQLLIDGRAGQLFEAMLAAVNQSRTSIYLASVFKCPPSEDLSLSPQCDSILQRQIALVQPTVVITFGEFAAQAVIKANESLSILRNSDQRCFSNDVAIIPTYSPAEMLDDPMLKSKVWDDLKKGLSLVSLK